jgi:hypothetical protein
MSVSGSNARRCNAGASLLEVLVALSLLATAMLGAAAAQLDALGGADLQAQREQAAWIGASLAEALQFADAATPAPTSVLARAGTRLPGARVQLLDPADGVGAVAVHWARTGNGTDPGQAPVGRACPADGETALTHCLMFPFVSPQ